MFRDSIFSTLFIALALASCAEESKFAGGSSSSEQNSRTQDAEGKRQNKDVKTDEGDVVETIDDGKNEVVQGNNNQNNNNQNTNQPTPTPPPVVVNNPGNPTPTPTPPSPPQLNIASDTFTLASYWNIDMVWVLDNSASMIAESAFVQANVESFVNRVKNEANIKLAVITKEPDAFNPAGFTLSSAAKALGHVQVNVSVLGGGVLQKAIDHTTSSLASFFRSGAKRVYVFVTDDVPSMTAQNFLTQSAAANGGVTPTMYSFHGFRRGDGCTKNVGTEYVELSTATAGKSFDICVSDWTPYFNELSNEAVKTVASGMAFSQPALQIHSVKVDGVAVDASRFSIVNNKLSFGVGALPANATSIKVEYSY